MKKILSITIALLLALSCMIALVACNKVADNTEHLDEVTRSLKLTKDYQDKDFFSDGISVATLETCVDGDTTRFKLPSRTSVTIRYDCIDTPESTGGVEKWGKSASIFNKGQLEKADLIVLEASTTPPSHDNYGVRYLGYVWYRTAGESDLKCLNLEMVENGFSRNGAKETSEYPYYSYFAKAEASAHGIKLRIFSSLDDPNYSDEPIITSISEINEKLKGLTTDPQKIKDNNLESNDFFNLDTGSGAKVQFDAYLESVTVSNTGTYTFVAVQYDVETGESFRLNVYAAYGGKLPSTMKIGDMLKIVGNIQEYPEKSGTFQVSGINYSNTVGEDGKDITVIKQSGYYLTFDSSMLEDAVYKNNYSKNVYNYLSVTEVVGVTDGVLTFKGTSNKHSNPTKTYEYTFTVKVPDGYNQIQVGSKLRFNGFQFTTGTVSILNYNSITII